MRTAIYALEVIAIGLAWLLTRRRREHLPVAVLLSIGLASDLVVLAARAPIEDAIARHGVDAPWTGVDRVWGHVSDAATLAWPGALVGAALAAFLRRSAWPAAALYAVAQVRAAGRPAEGVGSARPRAGRPDPA